MGNTIDIRMPSLGADMAEGTLNEWLVNIGDQVKKGDIIAVIETDKGAIDMESYHAGKISEILVQPVKKVKVGTVLAKLDSVSDNGDTQAKQPQENIVIPALQTEQKKTLEEKILEEDDLPEQKKPKQKSIKKESSEQVSSGQESPKQESPKQEPPEQEISQHNSYNQVSSAIKTSKKEELLASPVVRKMAEDHQLDLSNIKGSGPSGAILLKDISGAIDENKEIINTSTHKNTHKESVTKINNEKIKSSLTNTNRKNNTNTKAMRKAIAMAMEKSKREIPHYYLSLDSDISKTQQWLHAENENKEPEQRQILLAVLLKAVASTLIQFPELNGYYLDNQFQPSEGIHIGNAISLRNGGLVVPAIHNVEKLSLNKLMLSLRDIINRSRGGRLRSSELSDASITVTNMGELGADTVFGVIYPPQVAIIGFGRPRKVPQVEDNSVIVSEVITISLSADHRVSDGTLGAKFLTILSNKLQNPELL